MHTHSLTHSPSHPRPQLPVFAHGDEVPDYLVMDLRGKKLGDKIMASEVELHAGLTMVR